MIVTKRIYEPVGERDGYRVLIDRLWPRGVSKTAAQLDEWAKAIAPSNELRHWYGHDPAKWEEFQRRYRQELDNAEAQAVLEALAKRARRGRVTLLYSTKSSEISNAQALAHILEHVGKRTNAAAQR
ncbi:MAG TPA: DUF488 family protein [Gemmatimonadaceae bacterium]|nr:DUF488 family protein [Gemmatimonadaceae bacterium]